MGAKIGSSHTTFLAMAFIKSSEFSSTSLKVVGAAGATCPQLDAVFSNGAYWYYTPDSDLKSFGFAQRSTVYLCQPDFYDSMHCEKTTARSECSGSNHTTCNRRVSWQVDSSLGGWRAGCSEDLSTNTVFRKHLYYCMVPTKVGDKKIFRYDQPLDDSVAKWLVEEGNKLTLLELAMPEVVGGANGCNGDYFDRERGRVGGGSYVAGRVDMRGGLE
jgi:hypothetical protein